MAFLGLCIYFFCLYIRPQDWIEAFLGWPVDYLIFGFIFLVGFFRKPISELFAVLKMRNTKGMIFWLLAIFLSDFSSGYFDLAFQWFFVYLKFLTIFVMFMLHIDSFSKLKWLFLLIITLTAMLGFQGIYQKQHGIGWAGQPLGWLDRIVWVGLWDGMNVLCLLFVVSFPFILQFLSGTWPIPIRLYALAAIFPIMSGIYLTESRGGFMSLLIIFMLHFRTRFKSKVGIALGIMVVCLMIAFKPSRFGDFNDEDSSASYRVDMWRESFEMITYNPLFGIGKGTFMNYTGFLIAHNSFLEVMGETGCLGLFLWLSLLYMSMRGLLEARLRADNEREKSLMEGLLICITSYLTVSFFVTCEFELLYVLLGLAAAATRMKKVTVEFKFNDFKKVLAIQATGMATFFIITRVYYRIF